MTYPDYSLVSEHCRGGLERYFEHHIPPGSFLTAVLSNDLMDAARRADSANQYRLFDYCRFLETYAPRSSYGSPEAVQKWLTNGDKP